MFGNAGLSLALCPHSENEGSPCLHCPKPTQFNKAFIPKEQAILRKVYIFTKENLCFSTTFLFLILLNFLRGLAAYRGRTGGFEGSD
jgi:hypothetical protein